MKLSALLVPVGLTTTATGAFTGMGGPLQQPYCAYACGNAFSTANLTCTMMMHGHDDGGHGGMSMGMTSPACRAGDDAFLTSLAYCMSTKCQNVPVWQLEQYWAAMTTGSPTVPAKWDYHAALAQVTTSPTEAWAPGKTLNSTMLVPEKTYNIQFRFLPVMDHNSILLYRYS